jgi:hypothetical protein
MTLTPMQVAALRELDLILESRPHVIIGAQALGFYYEPLWRTTLDVDLVVAADLDEFPLGIDRRPGWRPGKYEHEFWSPGGVKLDIVPASERL